MLVLSRHDRVSPGSDRGFCVAAEGTGSSRRRGTTTNAPNDRVLRSTDGSLDDLIQHFAILPFPALDNQPKSQADVAVVSSDDVGWCLLSLVGMESAVPSFVFSRPPLTRSLCSPSSCHPSPIPVSANASRIG
jgi:hypothetical protein